MKITDRHIFFWGGVFSNWYPSEFIASVNGKAMKFHNVEQYFMYMKAITFKDYDAAMLILKNGHDPSKAKQYGRAVKNYDDETWAKIRYSVMLDGCQFKFSQNENMKEELLKEEYIGKEFVEGSPRDCIWGIGVHYNDASDDESTWRGQNLLGLVLNEVRSNLLSQRTDEER